MPRLLPVAVAAVCCCLALTASAAMFYVKNCAGDRVTIWGYDDTDTHTVLAVSVTNIENTRRGTVSCGTMACLMRIVRSDGSAQIFPGTRNEEFCLLYEGGQYKGEILDARLCTPRYCGQDP
ncbi:MAG: hypothetical protein AB7O45_12060 [Alphaproteobacteria bacterium]